MLTTACGDHDRGHDHDHDVELAQACTTLQSRMKEGFLPLRIMHGATHAHEGGLIKSWYERHRYE